MINDFNCNCSVYLASGYTDLRRGVDGLATIVEQQINLEPCTNALFLFCGRRTDRIKVSVKAAIVLLNNGGCSLISFDAYFFSLAHL